MKVIDLTQQYIIWMFPALIIQLTPQLAERFGLLGHTHARVRFSQLRRVGLPNGSSCVRPDAPSPRWRNKGRWDTRAALTHPVSVGVIKNMKAVMFRFTFLYAWPSAGAGSAGCLPVAVPMMPALCTICQ